MKPLKVAIFLLFLSGIVFAQSLEEQFQAADAELNRVYKELRSQLNDEQKDELKKSQLAWIKEKDRLAKQARGEQEKFNILKSVTIERTKSLLNFKQPDKRQSSFGTMMEDLINEKEIPDLIEHEMDVRVQSSDSSEGFAALSKTLSLLATGNGNKINLWDINTGYLLKQKHFSFDITGLIFDKTGKSLWVFWNDNPRYGEITVSKIDPTNFNISPFKSTLDFFRPGGASCIASPESGFVVVSKSFTFNKSPNNPEDHTELSLFQFNFQESNSKLPKIASLQIKGLWNLGLFINNKVFKVYNTDGKEQYIIVEDFLLDKKFPSTIQLRDGATATAKIFPIEEIIARRGSNSISNEIARTIRNWKDQLNQPNAILEAIDQELALWKINASSITRKILTSAHRGTSIALKDKIPTQQPPIKDIVADDVVLFEKDLRLFENKVFLNVKRKYWIGEQGKKYPKTDLISTQSINLNALSIENPEAFKMLAPKKISALEVNEDGAVMSGDGRTLVKLKNPSERALAWALPESNFFLIARQDYENSGGESIIESVDQNGVVISSAKCGDLLDICYGPEIAFSPDKSAFALFGYGRKNHSAPVNLFDIKMSQSKPMIRHLHSHEQSLLSDSITLDFYPYVLHLKPQCVYVTRFDSNEIVSQWGVDPSPGYASETIFATDIHNRKIVVLDDDKIHILNLAVNGSINLIGTLKQNSSTLTFYSAENYYIQRGDSSKGVHFVKGFRAYPFEQFDLRLNRPDIVLERLGAPDEAIAIAKQLREKRLKRMGVTENMFQPDFHLPEIDIVGDLPSSTAESELALKIKASDSKYPLDRLRLYVNNVPVNGKEGELLRDAKSQSLERTIPIKLAAGRNKIQVSVLNSAGAESLYANAAVTCTAQRPKPTLYAVAMGVSEYSNPDWNLKYAAKDARDILERVKARSGSSYGEIKELLLTDREATKESLGKIRDFLSKATVDDTVLLFVAGHGLLDSKYDYYFGTSDIDFDNPSGNGIAFEDFDDLLAELPCLRKSLLIDTCHAGELDEDEKKMLASAQANPSQVVAMLPTGARGMTIKPIEGARGKSEWYDRLQGLFVDLRRGSGSTILSSSAGAEYALESSEQKNGLFTYAVLEALDGKEGSDANKDGSVTMSELADYVKTRVAALTNNKQSPNVRRVNLESDFALSKK